MKSELMRLPNNGKQKSTASPNGKLCINVKEAADLCGISMASMYEIARREDFPSIRAGKRIIIPYDRFVRWLNETAAGGGVL
ncbi:MAG: helix-turn-helix domain-containing protein [Eubacteriales bacterium]|nr:helix-turn-helix domain-containing protein [Eubacteriales bacterium]